MTVSEKNLYNGYDCFLLKINIFRREQKRRALSAVILKVQIISQKMMDMMFDSEMYNFDGFKALLSKTSDVVAEAYEHIPTVYKGKMFFIKIIRTHFLEK